MRRSGKAVSFLLNPSGCFNLKNRTVRIWIDGKILIELSKNGRTRTAGERSSGQFLYILINILKEGTKRYAQGRETNSIIPPH
jgi:hypothetical protein